MVNVTIAKTLSELLDNPRVSASLDRGHPIRPLIYEELSTWRANLSERRPAPVYLRSPDGELTEQVTDLDLFTVLMELSQRRAVITLDEYKRLRASSLRSNQRVVAGENRHGHVLRPISNLKTHAFSALIKDFNVIEKRRGREIVGAPRNFTIVEDDGTFYQGWINLEWDPSEEEKRFISEHQLEVRPGVTEFKYFVHPALAASLYGSHYLEVKTLDSRLRDQAKHYKTVAKRLRDEGIKLPPPKYKEEVVHWKEGETVPRIITSLEAELILPPFRGEYPIIGMEELEPRKKPVLIVYEKGKELSRKDKVKVLRYALYISKKLSYKYGPMVRVPVRAVELAFFLYGFKNPDREEGTEIRPGWAVPEWQRGYKTTPRAQIKWNSLPIRDDVRFLYRIRETTVRRSAQTALL